MTADGPTIQDYAINEPNPVARSLLRHAAMRQQFALAFVDCGRHTKIRPQ